MQKTKWILFDFGGCLDSDGLHTRSLYMNQFSKSLLINPEKDIEEFNNAYTKSDTILINDSLVLNSSLKEMNEVMCLSIAKNLNINSQQKIKNVASAITKFQEIHLRRNQKIIEELAKKFKLGVVSNFSGNLLKILDDYSLAPYFTFVLDSYHVGVSKPDPKIFKIAIDQCQAPTNEIVFVGDNPERDISPARALGMKTILISSVLQKNDSDYLLRSLTELLELSHNR
jgi:HAD superfamily hydrolase (TIGR01549 family)